ncbi:6-bladed beta-propeller [Shewanella olleyana]|uniref:6-bladed beta-propeller n=1 Tax=Shewanella olleyana TaxID=135626 RepID=UPI00200E7FD6|nr:6-bladed beta-propeller [Shewanella olleyana]MCL1065655.1 6-bladed beta-propeller [Shewanella olleyana]
MPAKHTLTQHALPSNGQDPHGKIIGQGEFTYLVDAHWGKLDPTKYPVENCHGFAMDAKGRIFMITDNPRNNILVYNQQGELLDAFSSQFPGGHAIKIVKEDQQEFIYVVDSGWVVNRHWDGKSVDKWDSPYNKVIPQSGFVAKMTLDGKLIYTIGHPQTYGVYKPEQPFRPTDIAIAPNGDLYVTDGYGSDFLLHYNKQGQYIHHWGGHDNEDVNDNLHNTHGIEIDLRDKHNPTLMVSSRFEQCLKVFSLTGEFIKKIDTNGAYIGGPVFKGNLFYAPVCWSHVNNHNADNTGFISIFDNNNTVIANLGATAPQYLNGQLQPMQSTEDVFNHVHCLCVDEDNNLYVGQWNAQQSYPMKLIRQ